MSAEACTLRLTDVEAIGGFLANVRESVCDLLVAADDMNNGSPVDTDNLPIELAKIASAVMCVEDTIGERVDALKDDRSEGDE